MSSNKATLHLLCGKIAAGKSTLASQLAQRPNTILVREDDWLARLYPGAQNTLRDYVRNATRLRSAMTAHLVDLLRGGVSIVLDFPANTPSTRAWMRTLFQDAECAHQLHYLDVPEDICKVRLRRRNVSGTHEFTVSDADFDRFCAHFVPPAADEAFNVVTHRPCRP